MSGPTAAREALIIEAIGEASSLIESVERLTPELQAIILDMDRAATGLRASLAEFEAQVLALTEKVKVQAVKHVVARTDEAARRSIDHQGRAMADAARAAFGTEVGSAVQRLRAAVQPLPERQRWERWLTHVASAAAASAATWVLAISLWAR